MEPRTPPLRAPLLLMLLFAALARPTPHFAPICTTSAECGAGLCCLLGMERFAVPHCVPRQKLGEICIPGKQPLNLTLSYPEGVGVHLSQVYLNLCPCEEDLTCDFNGVCSLFDIKDNEIDFY